MTTVPSPVTASDLRGTSRRVIWIGGRSYRELVDAQHLPASERLLIAAFCATWRDPDWSVKALVAQGADVHARDDWGRTPLHLAAHEDRLQQVFDLLEAGADVNAETTGPHRWAPLHGALTCTAWSCVDVLVNAGADLNLLESAYHRAALIHVAGCSNDRAELVPRWLALGANPRIADSEGHLPLHLAAAAGTPDNVHRLLDAGSPVDALSNVGMTPLLKAVANGREEAVALLLTAGATPFATSDAGLTARGMALRNQEKTILKMLDAAEARWIAQEQAVLLAALNEHPAPSTLTPETEQLRKRL